MNVAGSQKVKKNLTEDEIGDIGRGLDMEDPFVPVTKFHLYILGVNDSYG